LKYLYIVLYTLSINNVITDILGKIKYNIKFEYMIGKPII